LRKENQLKCRTDKQKGEKNANLVVGVART